MIICGYCETKNNPDNAFCIACGGPLDDDISQRRNTQYDYGLLIFEGITKEQFEQAKQEFICDPKMPNKFIQLELSSEQHKVATNFFGKEFIDRWQNSF